MSILLDALRKSEQRERLGATPDIHSSEPLIETTASRGWRTATLVTLAVVVLAAGAYGAWIWWSGSRVPVAAPEFTAPAADGTPSPAAPDGSGVTATQSANPTADAAPGSGATQPDSPRLSSQPRSPVENLSGDRPYRPAPAQSARAPAAAARAPERQQSEVSDADLDAAIQASAAAAQRRADARARRLAAERPAPPEPDDGSISYWQLPENVRGGLPELKINVMVYDEDPARRFIIMGGKRYGEGDEVVRNLTVESVRRDRALFRHGAYLFFVKQ